MGARFSAPVQTGPGTHSASYTTGTASFPGLKRPGCGFDHLPSYRAEVKERVQLYIYSPSGLSWPVLGSTFPFLVVEVVVVAIIITTTIHNNRSLILHRWGCQCCWPTLQPERPPESSRTMRSWQCLVSDGTATTSKGKVRLHMCIIKHHITDVYWGVAVAAHSLYRISIRWRLLAGFTLWSL